VWALVELVGGNEANQTACRELGAIPPLLSLLDGHPDSISTFGTSPLCSLLFDAGPLARASRASAYTRTHTLTHTRACVCERGGMGRGEIGGGRGGRRMRKGGH
jgi:hypothetical protein